MRLTEKDRKSLETALDRLERQTLVEAFATRVGSQMTSFSKLLPTVAQDKLDFAVHKALEAALNVAVGAWTSSSASPWNRRLHTAATAFTGGLGGFCGIWGVVVELPISTTIILHSIAGIARSHGEDLSIPANRMACLEVLALGPGRDRISSGESRYYSARIAMAIATQDAAVHIAEKGLAEEGAPQLVLFLNKIAARFGAEVSERAAAEAIPLIGAVGGAALNLAFTTHFHNVADAHFTIRRLERTYGSELIRGEYARLLGRFELSE